jgi:hypothetical protein
MDILHLIRVSAKAGADEALISTGQKSPMVSKRDAIKVYGSWFTESCKAGRLHPCMVGNGKNGTHWYSVREIDALMIKDATPAELIWK